MPPTTTPTTEPASHIIMEQKTKFSLYESAPLLAGSMIMLSSGSANLVSAYSSRLQDKVGMSSNEISLFMTLVGIGSWFGIIPMSIADSYGPKYISLVGACLLLLGYGLLSAAVSGSIEVGNGAIMFFGFVIGQGSAWAQASAIVSNTVNTRPEHRGAVMGILQANFSLAAGLYEQFLDIFAISLALYLLIIGSLMAANILIAWPSNHLMQDNLKTDSIFIRPMGLFIVVLSVIVVSASVSAVWSLHDVVLACYFLMVSLSIMLTVSVVALYGTDPLSFKSSFVKRKSDYFSAPCCFGFLVGYGDQQADTSSSSSYASSAQQPQEFSPLIAGSRPQSEDDEEESRGALARQQQPQQQQASMTLMEALRTPHFWMLFYVFAVGVGGGLTILDNISWIVNSHSPSDSDDDVNYYMKANAVALFAAFNTITRVAYGFLSDWLLVMGLTRSWLVCINSLFFALTCMLMAYAT
jgi:MFS family permease